MNWKKTLLICLIIFLTAGAATTLIFSTEPTATRSGATQQTAMLVDVIEVQKATHQPTIKAMGTVVPAQDVMLSPRVSGEIISLSKSFTPGGYVEKGETLLQIDPRDYENALEQRKSELEQIKSDLTIEMGLQQAAEKGYQTYGDTLSEENQERILRKPQLAAVQARLKSAEAAVEQAKLDLERTTVKAPFDAHILSRSVNIGSQVTAGTTLGRLVGLEEYWVEATVPLSKLRWLTFPDSNDEQGSPVTIRNRTAWDQDQHRTGYLHRQVGALEDQTRLARVLITVPDPHARSTELDDLPPLIVGSFVEASIKAEALTDVVRLSRSYIRQDDTVWVMEDGKLAVRDVNIRFQDADYAYITEGLNDGDRVVTTNLSTTTEGSPLRLEGSESSSTSSTE